MLPSLVNLELSPFRRFEAPKSTSLLGIDPVHFRILALLHFNSWNLGPPCSHVPLFNYKLVEHFSGRLEHFSGRLERPGGRCEQRRNGRALRISDVARSK